MSAQSPEAYRVTTYLTPLQLPLALAFSKTLALSLSLSLSPPACLPTFPLKMMRGMSSKGLTLVVFIAFLVWSSNFEACIARRGKHWRQSRAASASLSKKKGSHGGSKSHHFGGSSPKAPPSHNASPSSPIPPKPKQEIIPTPPKKRYNGDDSTIFNVLDFGAKGRGDTDDTKVPSILPYSTFFFLL